MDNTIHIGIKAEWRYWVTTKHGVVKNYRDWTKNVILNSGLTSWLTYGSLVDSPVIALGDNATTPAITQTALAHEVYRTTLGVGSPGIYDSATPAAPFALVSRTIPAGTGDLTIREMGLVSANNTLFNRTLVLDIEGNPTTVVKQDADTMTVECRITLTRSSETFVTNSGVSDGLGSTIDTKTIITNAGLLYMLKDDCSQFFYGTAQVGSDYTNPIPTNTGCVSPIASAAPWMVSNSSGSYYRIETVDLNVVLPESTAIREIALGKRGSDDYNLRTVLSRDYVKPLNKTIIMTYRIDFTR